MITKKLLHDILTLHNKFINNKGIITSISVYNVYTIWVCCSIRLWSLKEDGSLDKYIDGINCDIRNKEDFIKYKKIIDNQIVKLLNK